jgi:hypothetical protein
VVSPEPGGGTSNAVFLPIHDPSSTLAFGQTDYYVGRRSSVCSNDRL